MEIFLFDHNELGYKKLCDALKNNRCATINHATGTGKSFIALKYLYEHRDKKYLYLAPTYQIIDQLKSSCYDIGITPEDINIDTMIYTNLLKGNMEEIYAKYDGIIFDEYHRIGAEETYKRVRELKALLESDTGNKKFIGLTATPIRFLDHERNMTDEIFDGVVASNISLAEAMAEGLLPIPTYVNSRMSCFGEITRNERMISRLPEFEGKRELQEKLKSIKERIEQNPVNIEPYIDEKSGKYIIFCSNIEELDKYYKEIDKWFPQFSNIKKFKVHSRQDKVKNKENLDEFNEQKEGLSVMLCVDVLNEGVHAKGVNGVFLLRKTKSPIIYFQQIGRALSFSGRKKQITIFDMQNNFGNHRAIDAIYEEFRQEIERKIELHPERKEEYMQKLEKFKIMDETKKILKELENVHKEAQIYNTLSCIYEYYRVERSIRATSEDGLKQQLLEKLYVIKEEIDNIEIDIERNIDEYKDINENILAKLDAIKKEQMKVKLIIYKFSCSRLYKILKKQIDNLPESDIKNTLLEELNEIGTSIEAWKKDPNKTADEAKKINLELEDKLKDIQNKYKYVNEIYSTLTCIKKHKKLEKHLKKINNDEKIVKEMEKIKSKIDSIEISLLIPIEKYQEINDEIIESLNAATENMVYIYYKQRCILEWKRVEARIRRMGNTKERKEALEKLESFKKKILSIGKNLDIAVEEYTIEEELKQLRKSIIDEIIIETQIEEAIKVLEDLEDKDDIFRKEEAKIAYAKISKYAKRVNNNQFQRLMDLDIMLPDVLSTSLEERKQILGQYSTIYEKGKNEIYDNLEEIIKFLEVKGKYIDLQSDDEEEQKIAEKYLKTIVEISGEQRSRLIKVLKEKNINLRSWEKVLLGEPIDENEIDKLIVEASGYVDIGRKLPEYLYISLNDILGQYDSKKYKEILTIIEKADIIEKEESEKENAKRYEIVSQVVEYIAENIDLPVSELNNIIIEKMKQLSENERKYVKRKFSILKVQQFASWIKGAENTNITEFCKKMRSIRTGAIPYYKNIVEQDLELYATINGVITFIEENDGKYPDVNSQDEQERRISLKIREFIHSGKLDTRFEQLGLELKSPWYNMSGIVKNIVSNRFKECDIKRVILNVIEFFQRNDRRPLNNSEDQNEAELAKEYEKICIGLLDESDIAILNKMFNSRKNISKAIDEYVKNLKRGRD